MSEALAFGPSKMPKSELILTRMLWIIICLLVLFFIAELIFHFIISPRLIIKNIIVKSDISLSEEEVMSIAGIGGKEYYFGLNPEEIQKKLEAYPLVKKAIVEKVFPDTLKLTLYGREALVIALAQIEGRSVPLVIDAEGVVFQIGLSISELDLPVISGLQFDDLKAGMELPGMLNPFFGEMKVLRDSYPNLFRLISEIRIIPKTGSSYELLLCPLTYSVKVRFGSGLSGGIFKNAVMILDLIEKQGFSDKVEEIDFRTGEVVYRIKEG